jgi:hypothetical protein
MVMDERDETSVGEDAGEALEAVFLHSRISMSH